MAGSNELDNEPSSSIQEGDFTEHLSYYQPLNKGSSPWS
jgi:hypothetical protein